LRQRRWADPGAQQKKAETARATYQVGTLARLALHHRLVGVALGLGRSVLARSDAGDSIIVRTHDRRERGEREAGAEERKGTATAHGGAVMDDRPCDRRARQQGRGADKNCRGEHEEDFGAILDLGFDIGCTILRGHPGLF